MDAYTSFPSSAGSELDFLAEPSGNLADTNRTTREAYGDRSIFQFSGRCKSLGRNTWTMTVATDGRKPAKLIKIEFRNRSNADRFE